MPKGGIKTRPKWKYPKHKIEKWKIIKGDIVELNRGKNAGDRGKVLRVIRNRNILLVEGVNLVKKAQKGNSERKGGFFSKEAPVHYSACALIDPQTNKRSSVKFAYRKSDGEKIRISKKTGLEIVKPPVAFKALPTRKDGAKDTPKDIVEKVTYETPSYYDELLTLRKEYQETKFKVRTL